MRGGGGGGRGCQCVYEWWEGGGDFLIRSYTHRCRFSLFSHGTRYIKDGRPYLFHSFRNKYFNKISLGNMLYFQNKL